MPSHTPASFSGGKIDEDIMAIEASCDYHLLVAYGLRFKFCDILNSSQLYSRFARSQLVEHEEGVQELWVGNMKGAKGNL